eukprot:XP_016883884.1 endoribonuclease YbeY isoform X7 [Homo sapiens]
MPKKKKKKEKHSEKPCMSESYLTWPPLAAQPCPESPLWIQVHLCGLRQSFPARPSVKGWDGHTGTWAPTAPSRPGWDLPAMHTLLGKREFLRVTGSGPAGDSALGSLWPATVGGGVTATHGLCHLLGFTHGTEAEWQQMFQKEKAVLDELGRRTGTRLQPLTRGLFGGS